MKKAVAYIRISKAETRSVSLEYQQSEIEKMAIINGYQIVAVECDNGISGKAMANRPGIQSVLNMVNNKSIDAVFCYRSDRISRNGIESVTFEALLASKQIVYRSVTEGILGSDNEDPLMSFLRGGLNQRERMIISVRTKAALKKRQEQGVKLGAVKYGQNDSSEKAVLDRCSELKASGFSTYRIAEKLNTEGYKPRRGIKFHQTQVVRMLAA